MCNFLNKIAKLFLRSRELGQLMVEELRPLDAVLGDAGQPAAAAAAAVAADGQGHAPKQRKMD